MQNAVWSGMRMQSSRKKIRIQTAHTACFADVTVRVRDVFSEPDVRLSDALPSGLGDWPEGALAGAWWALRVANSRAAVEIIEIVGTVVDTRALTVAVAAAHAVWELVGFEPPSTLVRAIDAMLRTPSKSGRDAEPLVVLEELARRTVH